MELGVGIVLLHAAASIIAYGDGVVVALVDTAKSDIHSDQLPWHLPNCDAILRLLFDVSGRSDMRKVRREGKNEGKTCRTCDHDVVRILTRSVGREGRNWVKRQRADTRQA